MACRRDRTTNCADHKSRTATRHEEGHGTLILSVAQDKRRSDILGAEKAWQPTAYGRNHAAERQLAPIASKSASSGERIESAIKRGHSSLFKSPSERLMIKPRRCLTAQSPINAISMPAEAAAAVSTRATARVRKYGPCRRQLEGSGGGDTRSCTRCAAVGSEPGGRAMDCTSVVAKLPTIRAVMCVNQLSDLTGPDSVPTVERKTNTPPSTSGFVP